MSKIFFPFIWLLKETKKLSSLSVRLTKITGKSKYPLHPKHIIYLEELWYKKDISKNDTVLDLGCGNGQHSIKIAHLCKKIIAVDQDENQLKLAQQIVKDKRITNINFMKMDLEKELSFRDKSFNKVLCLDVLEHLNNDYQLLKEIKRILKPKGLVFLTVPNKTTSWKKLQKNAGLNYFSDPDHKKEYSLGQIKKEINNLGLRIIYLKPVVFDTPWSGLIDLVGSFSLKAYKKLCLWKKNLVLNNLNESIGFRIILSNT